MKKCMMIVMASFLLYGVQTEAKLSAKEESELRKAMIDYKKASDPKKRAGYQKTIDKYAQKYPNDPLVKAKLNEKARFDQGIQKPKGPVAKPVIPVQPSKPAAKPQPAAKPMPAKPIAQKAPAIPVTLPDLPPRLVEAVIPVSVEALLNKSVAEQDAIFARIVQEPSTYNMRLDYYDKYITARVNQFVHDVKNAGVTILFDNTTGNITREFQVFMPSLKDIIVRGEDVKRRLGIVYQGHGRRNAEDVSSLIYNNPILLNLAKNTQGRYVDGGREYDYFELFYVDLNNFIWGRQPIKYNI